MSRRAKKKDDVTSKMENGWYQSGSVFPCGADSMISVYDRCVWISMTLLNTNEYDVGYVINRTNLRTINMVTKTHLENDYTTICDTK